VVGGRRATRRADRSGSDDKKIVNDDNMTSTHQLKCTTALHTSQVDTQLEDKFEDSYRS